MQNRLHPRNVILHPSDRMEHQQLLGCSPCQKAVFTPTLKKDIPLLSKKWRIFGISAPLSPPPFRCLSWLPARWLQFIFNGFWMTFHGCSQKISRIFFEFSKDFPRISNGFLGGRLVVKFLVGYYVPVNILGSGCGGVYAKVRLRSRIRPGLRS